MYLLKIIKNTENSLDYYLRHFWNVFEMFAFQRLTIKESEIHHGLWPFRLQKKKTI